MSGLQFTDATATSERPEDEIQVVPGETWLRGPDDPIRSKVTHTFFNKLKANFNKLISHYGSTDDGDDMLLNAVRNAAEPYTYVSTIGPPTASDNASNTSGRGEFALGSKWYDKSNSEVYRCMDPENGVWVKTSLTLDELGNAATLNTGTEANEVVQLDSEGKLPAVDGSKLLNIDQNASLNPVPGGLVGVNAIADTTNRLSINSPASLFNHEGSSHQLKINKNSVADTASILCQTGGSRRAEFGLIGDDDFHMKVSPDGSTFRDAIVINKDTGKASFPNSSLLTNDRQPVVFKASGVEVADYSRSWVEGTADIANIGPAITATPSADAEKLLCFIQVSWSIEQAGTDDDARGFLVVRFENSSGSFETVDGPYALLGYRFSNNGRLYNSCSLMAEVDASEVNASGDWNISLAFDPSDDSSSGFDATFTIHNTHYILQEVLND